VLANVVIPAADPIPLPAPVWLLKFLLILTFLLHLLAMNVLLGGTFIALVTRIKKGEDVFGRRLVTGLFRSLPAFFAAAITLGIAPFLFVQTLYGQFIFTSSILMGWPWLSIILIINLAYYGMYILAFRRKQNGLVVPLLSAVFLLLCLVAFLYVNNFTLMMHPEKWQGMYHASAKGTHLHLSERMLIPRLLHFGVGAVAIGALSLLGAGYFNWKRDREFSASLFATGGTWFVRATIVQLGVGLLFLISLPQDKMMLFMGGSAHATGLFLLALVAIGGAIALMLKAAKQEDPRLHAGLSAGGALLTVVLMVLMRDALRNAYLAPYLENTEFAVAPQWSVFAIFASLLVAGALLWGYMIKLYFWRKQDNGAAEELSMSKSQV
jgi:hypothetical protein